jgi:hypothetical protein
MPPQKIVHQLPSFIFSSFELKQCFDRMPKLPANSRLFMFDAVSMYTKIDADHALTVIAEFLHKHELTIGLPTKALIAGLDLIMRCNVFKFSDTHW